MVSVGTADAAAIPRWFDEGAFPQTTSDFTLSLYRGVDIVRSGEPIGASGWHLALAMGVDLEYTDGYVIATSPWVDEYGYGDTKESAIADLLLSLLELRQSLERQKGESQLSDELAATLDQLNILLTAAGG